MLVWFPMVSQYGFSDLVPNRGGLVHLENFKLVAGGC